MARTKQYVESEVIEKAMRLFWRNGYESTSMQMLEKEMGINKFSIYSSFGSKHGVFLESLKSYQNQNRELFNALKNGTKGTADIKQFFYDSVNKNRNSAYEKGCLVTNTYYEFADSEDLIIKEKMTEFMNGLKTLFVEKLKINSTEDEATIWKKANYLVLAKHGLAAASRVNNKQEIEDYIEMTFKNI